MNGLFHPTGRAVVSDQAVAQDVKKANLRNREFKRLVAVKKTFVDCDFSYSHFESAYLRNCIFDSCKFVGCKFSQSNLRGSKFHGCVFDYAEFSHSQVEPEILNTGCPGHENLQQKFARSLRINFHQIGDAIAANKAIKVELDASRIHLKKAWNSRESYYRKKYQGKDRFFAFIAWADFVLLDMFWGNGESALKLLRSLGLLFLIIALGDVFLLKNPAAFTSYVEAAKIAPQVFIGTIQPTSYSGLVIATITGIRYVMLACLVSILVKRLSRR